MKIALAQLNYHVGNFEGNFNKMKDAIRQATQQHCHLVVFAELAVCGYPPRDFLDFEDFIDKGLTIIDRLAKESASSGLAIVVGAPARNPVVEGKDLFNAAYFIADGEIRQVIHKSLLPTYDIFDEYRYFEPAGHQQVISFKGKKIALTICEDLWNLGYENPLYTTCPMDHLAGQKPDLMINIAASPFAYDHATERLEVLSRNAAHYKLPLLYVNHVGAQTEIIFDGGSVAINSAGQIIEELPYFQETISYFETDDLLAPAQDGCPGPQPKEAMHLIHDALVEGIRNYFSKLKFSKAILGLSGGIDSALVLVLACRALGAENVLPVMMPSEFSSTHSILDARQLADRLGVSAQEWPIHKIYDIYLSQLKPSFEGHDFDITEENLQARIRANLVMALSNKFGYILLNTSNKSEMAVGYGTLYGDLCGGLSVIGDLYKTQVYDLCKWINRKDEVIPEQIINKPPSAELRPDQFDSDSLPPYDILDKILFQYIERTQSPQDIIDMGFDRETVAYVLRLVNTNEFKRYQTPPVLRVSSKAFGMGRRLPIVAKYLS